MTGTQVLVCALGRKMTIAGIPPSGPQAIVYTTHPRLRGWVFYLGADKERFSDVLKDAMRKHTGLFLKLQAERKHPRL